MDNSISRRAAILSSLAALATAAVPKADAAKKVWQDDYGECVEHRIVPEPTKVIPGVLVRVHEKDGPKEFGPVFHQKCIEQMTQLVDLALGCGVTVELVTVVSEVTVSSVVLHRSHLPIR